MAEGARAVRVFVSSPGDVAPERGRAEAVAAKLNGEYEDLVRFETVLWEASFYKADRTFQPQILEAAACDVVVSIFWTTIGTELPPEFERMPDGRPYLSGTVYELLTALEASRKRGVPDVYVFRKTANAERRHQMQAHLDALEGFWSEWFKSESGQFKAAFQSFASTDAFEQQFEALLRQWLQSHGLLGRRVTWPKEKGSPFRGLAPFEAEHAAVFFGRSRAIDEARRRLAGAEEGGTPFLLIVGASGSGKSSLARAGLIPRLTTPGVVSSIDLWRAARMKPSEGQAGPLLALALALFDENALPELRQGDFPNAAALADHFGRGGEAAAQPVLRALERTGAAAQRERHTDRSLRPALVLLVDQFEELFAKGMSDVRRAAFAEILKQLIATRRIWMVVTLRADFYDLLIKDPVLKSLKEAGASLDLGPPGLAELADIVRAPAQAAGLTFESDPAKGALDERLLTDAKTADSLPLLQFTLQQLYEQRAETKGETQLTHKAYDALGGLQGAIAVEAERAMSGLGSDAVATLPRLLRRLAEPARDGTTLTLREVLTSEAEGDASEASLLDALLAARILITRTDAQGRATVRMAHDAVFVGWPRAKDAAQANQAFYRVRAEVEDALRRWEQNGRPKDRLIQSGVPLAEAEDLVRRFNTELSADLVEYVAASRRRARRRQQFERAAAVFFLALAVATTAASVLAYRARDRAKQVLVTMTETGNTLVYDLGPASFVRGMPTDLLGRVLDRAIQGYDQAIQIDPTNAAPYISRGFAYTLKGNNDRAIQDYDQAIQLDPTSAVAYRNRGVAYATKGDNPRAIQDLDQAIRFDPKDAIAYVSRGTGYTNKGDHDRAIEDFDQAIRLDPANAAPYIARGTAYASKRDHDRAIQDFDRAIELNPGFPFAYVGRGDAYRSKNDQDRAIKDYDQAIQVDPKNPKNVFAYIGRGIAYTIQGNHDHAIRDYDQAIQLDPKNASAFFNRGLAYASKGEFDRAIQDYDQAIQFDPKNAAAYANRGDAYGSKVDYDRAIQDYDRAIQLNPKNANANVYAKLGRAYFCQGNFRAGAGAMLRANELEENVYSMIWRYLARERAGEDGAAELAANAARLKSKDWPYPVVELYLGGRSPADVLAVISKPDERCEAQFYSGEWHLLRGNRAGAATALQAAADTCSKEFDEYAGALAELKRLASDTGGGK
jgi:tetratricopeptide (TPR) repeat protein